MRPEVYEVLRQMLKGDLQHYQHRHLFRLEDHELMHISHRVTITFEELELKVEANYDGEEYQYDANKEQEFFWHIWFDKDGRIWFLNDVSAFPRLNGEFPFQIEKDYDRRTGCRHYFFYDIIEREVMDKFVKVDEKSKIKRIFDWGFDLEVEKLSTSDYDQLYPQSIFAPFL